VGISALRLPFLRAEATIHPHQDGTMIRILLGIALGLSLTARTFAQTTLPATRPSTVGKEAASAEDVVPLDKGLAIPKLTLKTVDGKDFDLNAAVTKQPTILIFYRGGWCPFCNAQMVGLQAEQKDFTEADYQLLAITPDKPEELAKSIATHSLTYTLLSDSDATAIRAFGLAFKVDDPTYTRMLSMKVDLEKASGQKHHLLPVPAVYILGTDGVVRFVHYDPDFRKRMDPAKILEEAKAALAK
jgi:peroxiredoxin